MEFLDIGSYGIWGEWHSTHPAPVAVRMQIVDMYLQAFMKTPLVFMSDDVEVMGYALAHGAGIRRDGVGSPWHEQNWIGSPRYAGVQGMADAWKKAPVVFEWYGNYDYLKSQGWSFDAAVNFMLNNHVSMINDNIGRVPPEPMPELEKLARLAGYRFVLREVAHEKTVPRGAALDVIMKWANVGVGNLCHPNGTSIFAEELGPPETRRDAWKRAQAIGADRRRRHCIQTPYNRRQKAISARSNSRRCARWRSSRASRARRRAACTPRSHRQ